MSYTTTELPVILLGSGGHSKVLLECLLGMNRTVLGVVSPDREPDTKFCTTTILGNDDVILQYDQTKIELVNAVGQVPGSNLREKITSRFTTENYRFATVIHSSAIIAQDVKLGEGCQIMAGVVIQPGAIVGAHTIINSNASIDHDCIIGSACHLAPGTTLSGNVSVGKRTHIGTGTSVIHNISIGDNCIISAGSIIYKSTPSNTKLIQLRTETLVKRL